MNVYGLDDTFSWFIAGAGGSHDLKFGTQYQLGEHYREDQRVTNGTLHLPVRPAVQRRRSVDLSGAADDSRAADGAAAVADAFARALSCRTSGRCNQHLTLSLGLRYDVHVSPITERWNPVLRRSRTRIRSTRTTSSRASAFAYSLGPASVIRGGYGLFYEKQWIDRFENYMLNPVFTNSFIAKFPGRRRSIPARADGRLPTDPLLVNGPTLNRALVNQLRAARARWPATPATVWLDTPGSDPAVAASGLDRLRAAAWPPAVVCRRLRAHVEPQSAAALQPEPGDQADHRPHGADHPRRSSGHRRPARRCRRSRTTSGSSSTSARRRTTASTCRSRSGSPTTGARGSRTGSATAAATPTARRPPPTISRCWTSATSS